MGTASETSKRVSWLSKVTARGVANVRASPSVLRKDNAALNPCAFKNAVEGENPFAVFKENPGLAGSTVVVWAEPELPVSVVGPVDTVVDALGRPFCVLVEVVVLVIGPMTLLFAWLNVAA